MVDHGTQLAQPRRCCPRTCTSSNVFARHGHKNLNTVILATRGKKQRKYRGFWLPRRKKHQFLRCFFAPRVSEKCENTTYVTIVRAHKNATIRCVASTTTATTTTTTTTTNNNHHHHHQQQQQEQEQEQAAQKCDKKMYYKLRYEKHITALCTRTRRAHEQHQRSHYT